MSVLFHNNIIATLLASSISTCLLCIDLLSTTSDKQNRFNTYLSCSPANRQNSFWLFSPSTPRDKVKKKPAVIERGDTIITLVKLIVHTVRQSFLTGIYGIVLILSQKWQKQLCWKGYRHSINSDIREMLMILCAVITLHMKPRFFTASHSLPQQLDLFKGFSSDTALNGP